MNTESKPTIDWIVRAQARAKGKRPTYFDDPAVEQLVSMVLALIGEVGVARERIDTLERLLHEAKLVAQEDIENYAPNAAAGAERALAMRAYVARIMRGLHQQVEALATDDEGLPTVIDRLAKT